MTTSKYPLHISSNKFNHNSDGKAFMRFISKEVEFFKEAHQGKEQRAIILDINRLGSYIPFLGWEAYNIWNA